MITKEKKKEGRWMVCKVQVSLSGVPSTLIYDESRRFHHQCEREFGEKLLGDELKGFFKMRFRDGELYVHKRVTNRSW